MPDNNRYARKTYSPDGVNREFIIDIPYQRAEELKFALGGVGQTYKTHWTLTSPTTARFATVPPAGSGTLVLTRNTDVEEPATTFTSPGTLTFGNLNKIIKQLLFGVQESHDRSIEAETILGQALSAADSASADAARAAAAAFEVTDKAHSFPNVAALRLYDGPAFAATIVEGVEFGDGRAGNYGRNPADTTSPDDNLRVIVDALGRRWWLLDQSMHILTAGRLSDDGSGDYVQDGGGIWLGGHNGVWLRQEGFIADNEEGSWAAYSLTPNRWCGLSIAPSGDPWDLPGENVTSLALQMRNGSGEERLTVSAKWFGDESTGAGEYRIAPFKNGDGRFWPLTISNNDVRLMYFNTDGSVRFTNENFAGASGGDTIVDFANPGSLGALRTFVRGSGDEAGLGRLTSGSLNYELQFLETRLELTAEQFRITHGQPTIWLQEADQPDNNKNWLVDAAGGAFRLLATNDAVDVFDLALSITRDGAVITNASWTPRFGFLAALTPATDDASAASAGVPLYGLYQASGAVRQRLT